MIIGIKSPNCKLNIFHIEKELFKEVIRTCNPVYLNHPNKRHTLICFVGDTSLIDGSEFNFSMDWSPVNRMNRKRYERMEKMGFQVFVNNERPVYGNAIFAVCSYDDGLNNIYQDLEKRDIEAINYLIRTGDLRKTLATTDYNAYLY